MKLLLISLLLFSCSVQKPVYTIRATVTEIIQENGGYWIYFRNSYRVYRTYQVTVPDSIKVGKEVEMPIVYRVK